MESLIMPSSPISDSGESSKSRLHHSWREKFAPFLPRSKGSKHRKGSSGSTKSTQQSEIPLEIHSQLDDEFLDVLKQVIRTILESKDEEVTKGALYRVLRKFARCQVDIKTLQMQLQRATRDMEKLQESNANIQREYQTLAASKTKDSVVSKPTAAASKDQRLTSKQVLGLQQMIMDLENFHSMQRSKHEQGLQHLQEQVKTFRRHLVDTSHQREKLKIELERQGRATSVCEQIIKALRDSLSEKDDELNQQKLETDRLKAQVIETEQVVASLDTTVLELREQVCELQLLLDSAESRASAINMARNVPFEEKELPSDGKEVISHRRDTFTLDFELMPQEGKDGGFLLSRGTRVLQQSMNDLQPQGSSPKASVRSWAGMSQDSNENKPWRVDELRKRRDSREEDMKQHLFRMSKASSSSGQTTAQSPDRDSLRSAPASPSERDVTTLKTLIAVQEALVAERDVTIDHLMAQVKDLSAKLDATVALTASLAVRDLARTNSNCDVNSENSQVKELQKTLEHSEGRVAKLKQELAASKRKVNNAEQKIKLLETFIMEDLQDSVVLGEVTESQRRKKNLDSFEESTRSILDESQMLTLEKETLKAELYELKSQLKIAQAMVTDLEKDRKILKARITQIDPLGEVKEKSAMEAKLFELSMELADVKVEKEALAEELQMEKHRCQRLAGDMEKLNNTVHHTEESNFMGECSEKSLKAYPSEALDLSF